MRLGIVRGSVVLNTCVPSLAGTRLAIVEPVTSENLAAHNGLGGGKALVAAEQLGAGEGQLVGLVEGRTAASPWYPNDVPVDAYCALIVDHYDYRPRDHNLSLTEVKP
jgi:microcompartment protein CcmK/EutM